MRATIVPMPPLDTELDRLFAPDYLQGMAGRTLGELRAMRAECQQAETAVSYLRRVAQGRLDLVHGILERKAAGAAELSDLVDDLPSLLGSGPPRPSGPGRLPSQMAPDIEVDDDITAEIDAVFDATHIGDMLSKSETELQAVGEQLMEIEARISQQRRELHERIDALQAEIVTRYKTGQASPDGLLT